MPGRTLTGPPLVQRLEGSRHAKRRLEVILETITRETSIPEACRRLGIEQAMLFRLRSRILRAGIEALEPKPIGRPPREASAEAKRIAELERRLDQQRLELETVQAKLEIARIMTTSSMSTGGAAIKKTTRRTTRKRRASKRGSTGRAPAHRNRPKSK
jgi:hypothetical protein